MNGFDIALTVLMVAAVLYGLVKGLVRIALGVGALVAAFVVASRFSAAAAPWFGFLASAAETRRLVAYAALFLGVLVAGGILSWALRGILKLAALGCADRLAGGALGLVGALLAAALVLMPVVAWSPGGPDVLASSRLARYVSAVADVASIAAPQDLARRYRERVEELRKRWRGDAAREVVTIPGHVPTRESRAPTPRS